MKSEADLAEADLLVPARLTPPLLATGYSLPPTGYPLLATRYSLLLERIPDREMPRA